MRGAEANLDAMFQSSSWQQSPERYSDTDSSACSTLSSSTSSIWELPTANTSSIWGLPTATTSFTLELPTATSSSTWELPTATTNSLSPPTTTLTPISSASWELGTPSTWDSTSSFTGNATTTPASSSVWNPATPSAWNSNTSTTWGPATSTSATAPSYTTLEPISSFLSTTTLLNDPDLFPMLTSDLCPSDPFHLLPPPTAAAPLPQGNGGAEVCSSSCLLPSVLGIDSVAASGDCGGAAVTDNSELEKARKRQIKTEMRKQRNKEAARRSNLNKKLVREQLEKKSLELWEENLQLQQDIRDLTDKLHHFRHVRHAMKHVCHRQQSSPLTAACR